MRVLILSWEYPPLIEGGLARHVRKLAENLAAQGVDVHVLARGREEDPGRGGRRAACSCTACASPSGRATWASSSPGSST